METPSRSSSESRSPGNLSKRDRKVYDCEECGYSSSQRSHLKQHKLSHSPDRLFPCTQCQSAFKHPHYLKRHMRIHTGEKPYSCADCGAGFTHYYSWQIHAKTHTGEKPHLCMECGLAFSEPSNLQRHRQTHSGERPFLCSQCGVAFARAGNLKTHMRVHTGEKPYPCSQCPATFSRLTNMELHLRSHSGVKPFQCPDCGARLSSSGALKTHRRIHTGEKPFSCDQCHSSFRQISHLQKHVRNHHDKPSQKKLASKRISDSSPKKIDGKRIGDSVSEMSHTFGQIPPMTAPSDIQKSADVQKSAHIVQRTETVVSSESGDVGVQMCSSVSAMPCEPDTPPHHTVHSLSVSEQSCLQSLVMMRYQQAQPQTATTYMLHSHPVHLPLHASTVSAVAPLPYLAQSAVLVQHTAALQSQEKSVSNIDQSQTQSLSNINQSQNMPVSEIIFHSKDRPGCVEFSGLLQQQTQTGTLNCIESSGMLQQTHTKSQKTEAQYVGNCTVTGVQNQPERNDNFDRLASPECVYPSTDTGMENQSELREHAHDGKMSSHREDQSVSALLGSVFRNLMPSHLPADAQAEKLTHQVLLHKENSGVESSGALVLLHKENTRVESTGALACADAHGKKLPFHVAGSESVCDWMETHSALAGRPTMVETPPPHTPTGGHDCASWGTEFALVEKPASAKERSYPAVDGESSDSGSDSESVENPEVEVSVAENVQGSSSKTEGSEVIPCDVPALQSTLQWRSVDQSGVQTAQSAAFCTEATNPSFDDCNGQHLFVHNLHYRGTMSADATHLFSDRKQSNLYQNEVENPSTHTSDATHLFSDRKQSNLYQNEIENPSTHTSEDKAGGESVHSVVKLDSAQEENEGVEEKKGVRKDRPFSCSHCGSAFARAGNLKSHLVTHTGEKPYTCHHCQAAFNRPWNLKLHMRSHSGERAFVCKYCGLSLSTAGALKTHATIHTGEKPFSCHVCDASFRLVRQLQKHAIVHHSLSSAGPVSGTNVLIGKKAFSCTERAASFENNCSKVGKKASPQEKPYKCKDCGLQFTEGSNLQRHRLTHTGEKPFLCAQCGAAFARAGNLKSHMTIHSGDKPFTCHKCSAKFNRSWNLKLHLRSHTGEKAFPCLECWANLSSAGALKTHMRIHTGEKPFVCKSCGAAFRQTGQLQKHVKIHHTFTGLFAAAVCMANTC